MIDSLATLSYLPLRLSGNQIAYTIDAASDSITDRSGLDYFLRVQKPKAFGVGQYEDLIVLPGREEPPINRMGSTIYPGAQFDVAVYLADNLRRTPPRPGQTSIDLCGELTMPFYVQSWIENDEVEIVGSRRTLPLEQVLHGRLSTEQFAMWRDEFFTTHLRQSRQFLTWQPAEKWVEEAQPEFLYFLVNFTPRPNILRLRVEVTYNDGIQDTFTAGSIAVAGQYTVYGFPVGFQALGLALRESSSGRAVHSYRVWVSSEANARLSEVRTYYVNREWEPNALFLLYANSLGGYDTLRCTGQASRSLTVKGTLLQTALATNYLPSTSELFSLSRTGERLLTVNTGLMDGADLDYLSELALSDEIYVVTQEGFVALLPADGTLNLQADDENLSGRTMTFRYSKTEVGYSALPAAPSVPARPTRWVAINPFCLIDEQGLRTGMMNATALELRYADDNSLVKPRTTKPNLPGTDGYVAPFQSALCATTPFVNALIQQAGTFRRSNCAPDQEGTVATLTIPAGTYGGETAEQLQSRIDAALKAMDTQEYANQYGSCLANPANYSADVPVNHFYYRSALPGNTGIYLNASPGMGNTWMVQGQPGAYVFAIGSNNLAFPTGQVGDWILTAQGIVGVASNCQIYINGSLFRTHEIPYDQGNALHVRLFEREDTTFYVPQSGDRLYVRITARS